MSCFMIIPTQQTLFCVSAGGGCITHPNAAGDAATGTLGLAILQTGRSSISSSSSSILVGPAVVATVGPAASLGVF